MPVASRDNAVDGRRFSGFERKLVQLRDDRQRRTSLSCDQLAFIGRQSELVGKRTRETLDIVTVHSSFLERPATNSELHVSTILVQSRTNNYVLSLGAHYGSKETRGVSSTKSPWIIDVTTEDFQKQVIERSRAVPVVVDFWAPWCGPCRMIGPILERLVDEKQGQVVLAKVNVDEAQDVALSYRVEGIPAVKAFRDGQPVLEFVGALPESQLRAFLDRIMPSESDRLVRQASDLGSNRAGEAETLYRRAVESDPRHEAAALGLSALLVNRGQDEEAKQILDRAGATGEEAERLEALISLKERARQFGDEAAARKQVEATPSDAKARYRLASILAGPGKYRDALDLYLSAAELDRKLAQEQVRPAMVDVFRAVGVRSPLADEYRNKLTRLLY